MENINLRFKFLLSADIRSCFLLDYALLEPDSYGPAAAVWVPSGRLRPTLRFAIRLPRTAVYFTWQS